MEATTFRSGLLNELMVTQGTIDVRRVGTARYTARFDEGDAWLEAEIWTTRKGRIEVSRGRSSRLGFSSG